MKLSVLFTPSEFERLPERSLENAACVVFDVLRATSTLVTALANGAEFILPVREIPEALSAKAQDPTMLLAGERGGLKIGRALTGSIDFAFGNSPREFTRDKVAGRRIAMTTTNGTRALHACRGARAVLACSFLNMAAIARYVSALDVDEVIVVCGGTGDHGAAEDTLGAGALCQRLEALGSMTHIDDSVWMARSLFELCRSDLPKALANSYNGRRLLTYPDLAADVPLCATIDTLDVIALADAEGKLRSHKRA